MPRKKIDLPLSRISWPRVSMVRKPIPVADPVAGGRQLDRCTAWAARSPVADAVDRDAQRRVSAGIGPHGGADAGIGMATVTLAAGLTPASWTKPSMRLRSPLASCHLVLGDVGAGTSASSTSRVMPP